MANPNNSKYGYLLERNRNNMDQTALTYGKTRKVSYEEMHDRIQKYKKILHKKGIRKGDIIGVCLLNTPESVYLLYALDMIGAIVVGFSPLDNKERIKKDLDIICPKMIITVDMNYSSFKDYEKALNFSTILYSPFMSSDDYITKTIYRLLQIKNKNYTFDRSKYLSSWLKLNTEGIVAPSDSGPYDDLKDIMFTGGSTGIHKGVDLPGNGLNYVIEGMDDIFVSSPGDVELGHIPCGHMVFGRMMLHYALCNNMQYALTLKATPEDFYDELVRTGAYGAVGGPPHWVSLIEKEGNRYVPSKKLKKNSLQKLHYATSGGEAMKPSTINAINEALEYCGSSAKVGDGIGATETWASIMINDGKKCAPDTLGKKINTAEVKLVNPLTNETVEDGEKGLLYVSGPTVMLGYHNNPEETNRVISYDKNGKRWCNLGDYLRKLSNDEYEYVGREKRNFVCGIENIYPEQLENFLVTIPNVREALVTSVSDDILQFVPSYHISLYDTGINKDEFEKKINAIVEQTFSTNWLPKYIEYMDEPLKRMANSKIDISFYVQRDKQYTHKN